MENKNNEPSSVLAFTPSSPVNGKPRLACHMYNFSLFYSYKWNKNQIFGCINHKTMIWKGQRLFKTSQKNNINQLEIVRWITTSSMCRTKNEIYCAISQWKSYYRTKDYTRFVSSTELTNRWMTPAVEP